MAAWVAEQSDPFPLVTLMDPVIGITSHLHFLLESTLYNRQCAQVLNFFSYCSNTDNFMSSTTFAHKGRWRRTHYYYSSVNGQESSALSMLLPPDSKWQNKWMDDDVKKAFVSFLFSPNRNASSSVRSTFPIRLQRIVGGGEAFCRSTQLRQETATYRSACREGEEVFSS